MKGERSGTGPITIIGNANVVGNNSSASADMNITQSQVHDALAALDEFIRQLPYYDSSVSEVPRIRKEVVAARAEMAGPAPKWDRIRSILRGAAASVAEAATLTALINNALTLISHL